MKGPPAAHEDLPAGMRRVWLRALAISVALASVWIIFLFATRTQPSVALANESSDHYSHVSAAALAVHHGSSIYTAPIRDLCLQPRDAADPLIPRVLKVRDELRVAPQDVCFPKEAWAQQPLVVNWGNFPRPYPPGNPLIFAPLGLAYAHGGISFALACAGALWMMLLAAHLAIFALAFCTDRRWQDARARDGAPGPAPEAGFVWLRRFALAAAGLFILGWSLAGFYDGFALLPLCVAAWAWRRQDYSLSFLAYACACFFHFRALWFLPLGLAALRQCASPRHVLSSRARLGVLAGLGLAGVAGICFLVLLPQLNAFPINHALHWSRFADANLVPKLGVVGLVLLAGWGALRIDPMLGACALCVVVFCVAARQAMPWHAMSLMPLLVLGFVPPSSARSARPAAPTFRVGLASLAFVALASQVFFAQSLWPSWLSVLTTRF